MALDFTRSLYRFAVPLRHGRSRLVELPIPNEEFLLLMSERLGCLDGPQAISGAAAALRWQLSGRPTKRDLLNTFRSLEALLLMGVKLSEALLKTYEVTGNRQLQYALACIAAEHKFSGLSPAEAFGHHPEVFDGATVGQIGAGQQTNSLAPTFQRLAEHLEMSEKVRSLAMVQLIYPAGVVIVLYGILSAIFALVVPKLSQTFTSLHMQLPLFTKILLSIGDFIAARPYVLAAGPLLLVLGYVVRKQLMPLLLAGLRLMPYFGSHYRRAMLAQNVATLSTLLRGGIQLHLAIGLVAETLVDPAARRAYAEAQAALEEGDDPTQAFQAVYEFFGPLAKDFKAAVEVGNAAGAMSDTLDRACRIYQTDFVRASEAVGKIIEPVMMTVVGLVVGAIVLGLWYPLTRISSMVS
ncbi:MAG: type II secretion system F family protein [Opitutaceae bacterium]|nr:type II secretion system F family protein [Opitutaceae bacterium]